MLAGVGLVTGSIHGSFQSAGADEAEWQVRMDQADWKGPVGEFLVETGRPAAPPTCVDLVCGPETNCPPHDPKFTGCYGVFWCCVDPAYEEKAGPKGGRYLALLIRCMGYPGAAGSGSDPARTSSTWDGADFRGKVDRRNLGRLWVSIHTIGRKSSQISTLGVMRVAR